MSEPTVYSIIESPRFPDLAETFKELGMCETKLSSMRKALAQIKKQAPDFILAEFFYGYGNNYAGVNISNLDVMLYSLQKYAAKTQVIIMVNKEEFQYVDKLNEIFPIKTILTYPFGKSDFVNGFTR